MSRSHVGEFVEELLVGDAIAAGDDEPTCEVVHPEVKNRVLTLAGADGQRAGKVGFPASGGRDDEQVRRIGAPVMCGIASHSHRRDPASLAVVDLGDGCARDGEGVNNFFA